MAEHVKAAVDCAAAAGAGTAHGLTRNRVKKLLREIDGLDLVRQRGGRLDEQPQQNVLRRPSLTEWRSWQRALPRAPWPRRPASSASTLRDGLARGRPRPSPRPLRATTSRSAARPA